MLLIQLIQATRIQGTHWREPMTVRPAFSRLVFCAAVCALAVPIAPCRRAGAADAHVRSGQVLQHVLGRPSAGAAHQAWRPRCDEDRRRRRRGLERKQVANGPNPQTGPFYVEGAEPGDMLVVTIAKLETNRANGVLEQSAGAVHGGSDVAHFARGSEPRRVTWLIDKAKGVARLDAKDVADIELPLRPMLGCLGVAPARREAIATSTPGNFGGNMDYAGLNAGVKMMFQVNEPGALLFLGDGHARQGEGEVVGTGLETSTRRGVLGRARQEEDARVAAARERHPRHGARQRATAA